MTLEITNETTDESYTKEFYSYSECRTWIINTLDLSLNWSATDITD